MQRVEVLSGPGVDDAYWVRYRWRAMGCTADVHIGGNAEHDRLAGWAIEELERLERCWSRFRADGELVALNAGRGRLTAVSVDLGAALDLAAALWRATGGAFDPTVHDALCRWGYDRDFASIALAEPHCGPAAADAPVGGAGSGPTPGLGGSLTVDGGRLVRFPAALDLGGVGKGLAADRLAEGLVQRGAGSVLVGLGGDLRHAGRPVDGGWPTPLKDPFTPGVALAGHTLHHGALVCSTTRIRRWTRGGRAVHHLIDPAIGAPAAAGLAAVFAAGPSAAWAEGMAKAALVLGARRGAELLAGDAGRHPDAVTAAWFVDDDRRFTPVPLPTGEYGGRGERERGVA